MEFRPKDWRATFCSRRCSKLRDLPTKECAGCGRTFRKSNEWSYAVWEKIRFCSLACRGNGKPQTTKECAHCGVEFVSGRPGRDKFCSHDCYTARLRSIVYPLRTRGSGLFSRPIKRLLMERAEGRCEACGSEEDLEFDHVVPRFMGGDGSLENGQVLCSECHDRKTLEQRPGQEEAA